MSVLVDDMFPFLIRCYILMTLYSVSSLDYNKVIFIILSQKEDYHKKISESTAQNLKQTLSSKDIHVIDSFDLFSSNTGAWTIFPLVDPLRKKYEKQAIQWYFFLNEKTSFGNVSLLDEILDGYSKEEAVFLGHGLKDTDHVVIHHYDYPGLSYPGGGSFVLSSKAMKSLSEKINNKIGYFPSDFSIDPMYELAKVLADSGTIHLKHEPAFCLTEPISGCALGMREVTCDTDSAYNLALKTLFAVKTCKDFHKKRLEIIKNSWARAVPFILYVSETEDPAFGTTKLPGVINTKRGHCQKTMSIIKHFSGLKDYDWLVIADDDTILSPGRLLELLSCYNPNNLVSLGERYGFRVALGEKYGYDYPTGGSGMVFSKALVKKMSDCECPSPDTPDDMHIGACLKGIGVDIIHSDRFHQARPIDYSEKILEAQKPISFHKFTNIDPIKTYEEWFSVADEGLIKFKSNISKTQHQEL